MAVIILTIYSILATLMWGVAIGKQLQREKNNEQRKLVIEQINRILAENPRDIRIELDAQGLPHILNEMQKDMKANLQGTQAVVKAMGEIKDSAVKLTVVPAASGEKNTSEYYANQLAYARDNLELTTRQKTVLNTIINQVIKKYGK